MRIAGQSKDSKKSESYTLSTWEERRKRHMRKARILCGNRLFAISSLFISVIIGLTSAYAADTGEVEKVLGVKGQMQEGAVVSSFPRSDIKVRIDGEPVPTALGFGSWTAWKAMGDEFMVMGDLVLLEKEINPVISALAEANIDVTAIHNHFIKGFRARRDR
jgi:hypothetical protein